MSVASPSHLVHHQFLLYGYYPTEYVCAIFIGLFGLSTVIHAIQSLRYRIWWLWPSIILAGFAEIIGWSARLWSSKRPYKLVPYEMQITTTIVAPTPLVAANFIILGRVIRILGTQYSRLPPKLYTIIFCSFDLIALIVQAVGGATAALAVNRSKDPKHGGDIMLGGIVFQLVAITVYVMLEFEFLFRYFYKKPIRPSSLGSKGDHATTHPVLENNVKTMIGALLFSTLCLLIRSIYRTIELANGWGGRIIHTEVYFNVLDGMMITLAMFTLNFVHPGRLLPEQPELTITVEDVDEDATPRMSTDQFYLKPLSG